MSTLKIRKISGTLGAEIQELDLSKPLDKDAFSEIEQALYTHKVLFFRDQQLEPEEQIAFSRGLGTIFTDHPAYLPSLEGYKEIVALDGQKGGRADVWHSDVSISAEPPMASVLYMKVCPDYGGDTMWADMTAAYDALSERMKNYLDGLSAHHNLAGTVRNIVRERSVQTQSPTASIPDASALPFASHPVIRTHPVTGKKILYVNPTFTAQIDGLPPAEGDAILSHLFVHQNQPAFQCRWRWREGDVAIWDNRATLHYAVADYGEAERVIHRVTICGEAPF